MNGQLVDDQFTRWPKQELVETYFNAAQKAIVLARPDANSKRAPFSCVAGTKQTIPGEASRLVDVESTASGFAISYKTRDEIRDLYPNWYATTGEDEPEAFTYDERVPDTFHLFPGVTAGLSINIVYQDSPPSRVLADYDTGDTDLDDIYESAIIEYMLYMAHSKDFEYSEQAKAQTHFQMFNSLIGIKSQSDAGMTPTDKD